MNEKRVINKIQRWIRAKNEIPAEMSKPELVKSASLAELRQWQRLNTQYRENCEAIVKAKWKSNNAFSEVQKALGEAPMGTVILLGKYQCTKTALFGWQIKDLTNEGE